VNQVELDEFMKSAAVKSWIETLPRVKSTRYYFPRVLKGFCDFVGLNADEVIEQRKKDLDSSDQRVIHRFETEVKRYRNVLADKGLSPGTQRTYVGALASFFKRNYYELDFQRGDIPLGETVRVGVRAASKDEIKRMVEVSDPRERALILLMKDTGLAEADIADLKLRDLAIADVSEIWKLVAPVLLRKRRHKTKVSFITFIGPEAFDALKTTLQIRMKGSPNLIIRSGLNKSVERAIGIPPETLTLDSPLFRSYERLAFVGVQKNIKSLKAGSISVIVRKAALLAGISDAGFSGHALRRFFQTSLENAGVSANWVKKMTGHALGQVEAAYSQPQIEMLKEAYVKAYPYLAISETVKVRSRVEFLEKEVERLSMNGHSKNDKIETQNAEIDTLKEEMQDMKKTMSELEGIFRESLRMSKEIQKKTDRK